MFGSEVPDKTLQLKVNQKMSRAGSGQCRVTATVAKGMVTLTGSLLYEAQRRPLVKAVTAVPGVRRVVDQMKHVPRKREVFKEQAAKAADVQADSPANSSPGSAV